MATKKTEQAATIEKPEEQSATKLNKSEEIRKAIKANPTMKNKEIAAMLSEQFHQEFKEGLVNAIAGKIKKPKEQRMETEATPFIDQLRELKTMIGVEAVKQLVDGL